MLEDGVSIEDGIKVRLGSAFVASMYNSNSLIYRLNFLRSFEVREANSDIMIFSFGFTAVLAGSFAFRGLGKFEAILARRELEETWREVLRLDRTKVFSRGILGS